MKSFPDTDIYALTDSNLSLGRSTITVVTSMLKAGIKLIQYREKNKSNREMLDECRILRAMTKKAGCCFIVNDHIDIAMLCDADGVHLGQDDISLADARKLLGDEYIIGVSAGTREEVDAAINGGADYLGIGALFSTSTKEDAKPVSLSFLHDVVESSPLPIVGIGGINLQTIPEVIAAGCRCCAIVSAITMAEDIEKAINDLRNAMRLDKQEN